MSDKRIMPGEREALLRDVTIAVRQTQRGEAVSNRKAQSQLRRLVRTRIRAAQE
jgi:hypothetical protein